MQVNKFSDLKRLRVKPRMCNYISYFIYKKSDYNKKGYCMKKLSDVTNFMSYNPGILLLSKPLRIKKGGIVRKTGKFSKRVESVCGDSNENKFSWRFG